MPGHGTRVRDEEAAVEGRSPLNPIYGIVALQVPTSFQGFPPAKFRLDESLNFAVLALGATSLKKAVPSECRKNSVNGSGVISAPNRDGRLTAS